MNSTFTNNLRTGDKVFDVELQRRGLVSTTPREGNRNTAVIFDGTNTAHYRDVAQLRFIPSGQTEPEDVAPFDGDLPALAASKPGPGNPAVQALQAQLGKNKAAMAALEKQFLSLRAENDRLDKAIAVLTS